MLFLTVCLFFNHCAAAERDYTETKLTKQKKQKKQKQNDPKTNSTFLFYTLFVDDF